MSVNQNRTEDASKILGGASDDDDDISSTTSSKIAGFENDDNDSEFEQAEDIEEVDDCGGDSVSPRLRSDSSCSRFVLEKTRRYSGFGSKDPLFRAVYLHDGSMTTKQFETYRLRFCNDRSHESNSTSNRRNQSTGRDSVSWSASFLNIFSLNNN
ncbi:unnamed protein product [Pseudo-nitzschia multistriata]|uniref:Uncharacterized protein n=1 Tax=Pseudo-nitzschia multistriata TaxID=183589 RepID=A0A448ZDL9_9STRA|nr:unnamed protein product [Pseudo-nitzschia multistriata]